MTDHWKYFPYDEVRDGQKELIEDIAKTTNNNRIILANAPTGLGKTASAISVAISKALEEKKKVFFLTNRHTQHKIAVETLQLICKKTGKDILCADLIGKKWMCNQEVASLFGNEFNEYCKSVVEKGECQYYNTIRDKKGLTVEGKYMLTVLKEKGPMHNEDLRKFSEEKNMCAYELAMALAKKANLIIGDYYYLFNPMVLNTILAKLNLELEDIILVVDEAHNLPGRVSEMMSSTLTSNMIKNGILEAKKYHYHGLVPWLNDLNSILLDIGDFEEKNKLDSFTTASKLMQNKKQSSKYSGNKEKLVKKETFVEKVKKITDYDDFIEELEGAATETRKKQKKSFLGGIANFLIMWQGDETGFIRIVSEKHGRIGKYTALQYSCLDPSLATKDIFSQVHSAVLMSGTLNPTFMYKDLLGINDPIEKDYKSPFPRENKLSLIVPVTSTKYNLRNDKMYQEIGHELSKMSALIPGNVAFFFPSYHLRDQVFPYFNSDKETFLEQGEMTKEEKDKFLSEFKGSQLKGGVLLGVAGANFAEGVDLPGDLLKAVVVVGLPLASPDLKTRKTIDYYDQKYQKGWDYAYLFPAMNKCLQSAGRCIRSGTDRGAVIYLDERFAWKRYYDQLPREGLIVAKDYQKFLSKFFSN